MITIRLSGRFSYRLVLIACFAGAFLAPLRAQVQLTVNASQTVRTVDERVFGLNAVMWDSYTSTPQTIALLQGADVRAIRIPGGSLSDEYHWRTNTTLANTWTWSAGFPAFAALISGLNAQAFVTVNYGTGTPQEAAAWVAYANAPASLLGSGADVPIGVDAKGYDWKTAGYWSALRNSAPLPANDGMNFLRLSRAAPFGLKYWEIGNECYGTWETDEQAVPHDPYTYGNRAKLYLAAMKAVDPTIKVGVVVVTGENSSVNNTSHPATNPRTGAVRNGWTPVLLTTLKTAPAAMPDFLIYHRYEQAPAADQPANPETDAGLLQKAKTWPQDDADLTQQRDDYLGPAGAGVELVVTENNSVYAKPGKQTTSLVNGLFLADSVGNILQTRFNALMWWDLRNGQDNGVGKVASEQPNLSPSLYGWRPYGDYGILSSVSSFGSATPYEPYPTYYITKLLSVFARGGDTVVQAASNSSLLSVFAVRRGAATLSVLVINKDPANALAANFAISGFSLGPTATRTVYGKPQDTAAQTGFGAVDLAQTSMAVSGPFATTFPSYSATVITFTNADLPGITTAPVSKEVVVGQAASFSVVASGGAGLSYQWERRAAGTTTWSVVPAGGNYSGAATATLTIAGPTLGMSGDQFRVRVSGSGTTVTSAAAVLTVRPPSSADFNRDGKPDLVWQNSVTGERAIWLMTGPGFLGASTLGLFPLEWTIAATADFNGDGKTDIVWSNAVTGERALWLMDGTTFLQASTLGIFPLEWTVAATGDFNADGKPDLIWSNRVTGERAIWLMNGTTFLGASTLGTFPLEWTVAATGDFNADGQPDLVWSNNVTGERAIWLMQGVTFLAASTLGNFPLEWTVRGTADFNGDGQPDLIWSNSVTGERALWLMNGTAFLGSSTLGVFPLEWSVSN